MKGDEDDMNDEYISTTLSIENTQPTQNYLIPPEKIHPLATPPQKNKKKQLNSQGIKNIS